MRIQRLLPNVINQIAAGEVIERPAAVLKELLENSVDAGAQTIIVDINNGGKGLIRVRDDGQGIYADDLPLAITSHATSKITQLDDLLAIYTLGFRGEALASIASISKFSIASKVATEELAWMLTVEGGGQLPYQLQPTAHPTGTTIEVRDLFFNTPVRRKFLKSDIVELNHIETMLKRLALSRFDIAFEVHTENKLLWRLAAGKDEASKEKRIAKLLGNSFLSHAVKIENQIEELSLAGWLGLPSFNRSQNDCQYIYLNGRMMRDKVLIHAIRTAYEDSLFPGRQPAYVLYLEVPNDVFDVNVHPGKQEVRFQDARKIHNFILSTLKQGLGSGPTNSFTAVKSDGQLDSNLQRELFSLPVEKETAELKQDVRTYESWTNKNLDSTCHSRESGNPSMYHVNVKIDSRFRGNDTVVSKHLPAIKVSEKANNYEFDKNVTPSSSTIITINDRYIIAKTPVDDVILCDLYAFIQHKNSLCLHSELSNGGIKTRSLAVPLSIKIPVSYENMAEILEKYSTTLKSLGLGVELLSADTLAIRQIPLDLEYVDPKEAVKQLLHCLYRHFPNDVSEADYSKLLQPLTKVMPPLNLTELEIQLLVTEIDRVEFAESIYKKLTPEDIVKNRLLSDQV